MAQLGYTAPTIESVRKILETITVGPTRRSVTPKQIIAVVSSYYDLHIDDLMGACRKKNLAHPRQIIMYLMREEIKSSYPAIGTEIGQRDHTTAMHAYHKISRMLEADEKLNQDLTLIRQRLYNM